MKYLLVIVVFVAISTVVTLYSILPVGSNNSSPVTTSSQSSAQQNAGYHQQGEYGRQTASLTRRVLVQEAQRVGIDKEESFRRSLKEYYEQSLVKVLTDRQLSEMVVEVSEADVDHYLACSGKIFTFTRFSVENGKTIEQNGHQNTVRFDDLSVTLRLLVAGLGPGERAKQFETGTEISVIRLDAIEIPAGIEAIPYDRGRIHEQLENHQRSLGIDRWINALRKTSAAGREEAQNE